MKLTDLQKSKGSRVMGIDASTHSLAFCIFWNRRPVKWGKIKFNGADIFERIADAKNKVRSLPDLFYVDFIAMEGAILANNRNVDVTIKLSLMYGAILSELLGRGAKVVQIKPTEWQNYIGNRPFSPKDKLALKAERPGMSASWYTTEARRIRKQRTMDYFNEKWPKLALEDDDVGDSVGLAYYGYYSLTKRG